MKAWAMRFIDNYVGRPLCMLLTLWRKLLHLLGLTPEGFHSPDKILFIKLEEQGAIVVASAALRDAIRRVGDENVYFCCFAENRAVLDAMNLLPEENVIAIRTQNVAQIFLDALAALIRIRMERIDTAIDLEFFARGSAVLAYLSGATCRVGLHRFANETAYRGDLMTHRVAYNPYLHTADAYLVLVSALDARPTDVPLLKQELHADDGDVPQYRPPLGVTESLGARLETHLGFPLQGPVLLLHPNVTDTLRVRKWPKERYPAVARRFLEQHPEGTVLFTGLPNEQVAIEGLADAVNSPRAHSLAGLLSFPELLTLLTLADVLVTNDSGPAHFAAMTGIHQVTLFGPETPALFRPIGGRTTVLYRPLACSPCLTTFNYRHSPCRENRCVQEITVEEVCAAVEACLTARSQTARIGA